MKSFVVDSSGKLFLSRFDHMRVEDPTVPFHPTASPSVSSMAFMAPELLQSFKSNGTQSLTQPGDVYALGCVAYEVSQRMTITIILHR